ncbi:hypothetical protein ES708_32574 [subsurface metagenome]
MQFLNSLYQKTILKILKAIPKYQPGQLCPADFLFASPTIGQLYNIAAGGAEETFCFVAPFPISKRSGPANAVRVCLGGVP